MADLTTKKREALKDGDFALPGRRYPIQDEAHARNALARVAQFGTSAEKETVRAAVHRKYPGIKEEHDSAVKGVAEKVAAGDRK